MYTRRMIFVAKGKFEIEIEIEWKWWQTYRSTGREKSESSIYIWRENGI